MNAQAQPIPMVNRLAELFPPPASPSPDAAAPDADRLEELGIRADSVARLKRLSEDDIRWAVRELTRDKR